MINCVELATKFIRAGLAPQCNWDERSNRGINADIAAGSFPRNAWQAASNYERFLNAVRLGAFT